MKTKAKKIPKRSKLSAKPASAAKRTPKASSSAARSAAKRPPVKHSETPPTRKSRRGDSRGVSDASGGALDAPKSDSAASAQGEGSKSGPPNGGRKNSEPRPSKYLDRGEGQPHRFEGRLWNGTLLRTITANGLEQSTDEGKSWSAVYDESQFVARDRWDLGRAIQKANKSKALVVAARPASRGTRDAAEGSAPRRAAPQPRTRETRREEDAALPVILSASKGDGWSTEWLAAEHGQIPVHVSPDGVKYVQAGATEKADLLYEKGGITARLVKYEGSALARHEYRLKKFDRDVVERMEAKK